MIASCVSVAIERLGRAAEFFALLGPSGWADGEDDIVKEFESAAVDQRGAANSSPCLRQDTTLRLIAGFEQPTSGQVLIRGRAMEGIPAYHRPVNTVFQDYALFPHLTVEQNIMFGLQMEGVDKKTARKRAQEALEQVRLPGVGERKPHQLSGGQQQRVALARALVKQPAVLLLDEPLGALDLKLRKNMQFELKALQRDVGITFIYVTHDQEEAITMADRIAVMNEGVMLQVGTPKEIYEHPETHFVADFIGETNFIPGTLLGRNEDGYAQVRLADGSAIKAQPSHALGGAASAVTVAIRPERIGIYTPLNPPDESGGRYTPLNPPKALEGGGEITVLDAVLVDSQYIGTDTRYTLALGDETELVARLQNVNNIDSEAFQTGQRVKVYWSESSTTVLDQ